MMPQFACNMEGSYYQFSDDGMAMILRHLRKSGKFFSATMSSLAARVDDAKTNCALLIAISDYR